MNALSSSLSASLVSAICAAALSSLAADKASDERKATLVEWWKAGDVYGASEAYVTDYAKRNGFTAHIVNSEMSPESNDEFEAIDVVFYMVRENGQLNEVTQCFTVWLEDMGHGAFVYGEW